MPNLWVAITAALAVRAFLLAVGQRSDRYLFPDSISYRQVASDLPGALLHPHGQQISDSLFRTPGYPAFLWLTGGASRPGLAVATQCILGAVANVWLAHHLARRLIGPRGARVVAWIVALDPAMLGHDLLVATETLATLLLLASLLTLHVLWSRLTDEVRVDHPWRTWLPLGAGAGVLLGALALVRPVMALLPVCVSLTMVVARRRRAVLAAAIAVLLVAAVPIGAWYARNVWVGDAHTLSTATGQNILDLGVAAATVDERGLAGIDQDPSFDRAQVRISRKAMEPELTPGIPLSAAATDRAQARAGRRLILRHPIAAAEVVGRAFARAWVAPGAGLLHNQLPRSLDRTVGPILNAWSLAWVLILDVGVVIGVASAVRGRRLTLLAFALGPAAYTMACSAFPAFYFRFRVPVTPCVAILAVSWIVAPRGSGKQDVRVADAVGVEGALDGPHGGEVGG